MSTWQEWLGQHLPPGTRETSGFRSPEQERALDGPASSYHSRGTPAARIVSRQVPGGHIGLFMGTRTLADVWPGVGRWIQGFDRVSGHAHARTAA